MKLFLSIMILILNFSSYANAKEHKISEDTKALCMLLAAKSTVPAIDGIKLKKIDVIPAPPSKTMKDLHFYNVTIHIEVLGKIAKVSKLCSEHKGSVEVR